MTASLGFSATSGIVTEKITVYGVGYTPSSTITVSTFNGAPIVLTPAIPATDAVTGNWTATFVVPALVRGTYAFVATDAVAPTATLGFTIVPSITVSPIAVNMLTAGVTITGKGFTSTILTGVTVGGVVPSVHQAFPLPNVVTGAWTMTFTVPLVPTTGAVDIIITDADETVQTTFAVADWIVVDIGGLADTESGVAMWGMPVITVLNYTVTYDRSMGLSPTISTTHTCRNDPRTAGVGSNVWDS
jgi:hypothetical protein